MTKKNAPKPDKIAKTDLVNTIATKTGLSKKHSGDAFGDAFDALLDSVTGALRDGKSVALPGLGTMSVKATAARTGVRPGTSQQIQIPAGKKVSSTLKDAL